MRQRDNLFFPLTVLLSALILAENDSQTQIVLRNIFLKSCVYLEFLLLDSINGQARKYQASGNQEFK